MRGRLTSLGPSPPHLPKASLTRFPPRRAILKLVSRHRAAAACQLATRLVAKHTQQHGHGHATQNAHTQNRNHDQVAPAILVRSRGRVGRPARVQRIGRRDGAQIAQPANKRGRGGDADFAVSALEDLIGPGHADGHGGAEAEADHEETAVAGPGVAECEGDEEQAGNLQEGSGGKEYWAEAVEAVRDWGDEEDSNEIHLDKC